MTMKAIAEILNVSISTVSKALNDATDISAETKARILNYISESNIELKKKAVSTKRICVLMEEMGMSGEHIGYEVMTGLRRMAAVYKYDLVVRSLGQHSTEIDYDREMKDGNFLGAFIMGTNLDSALFAQLKSTQLPTVVLDSFLTNPHVATISVDNIHTVSAVVDHLAGLGHKRIGMLNGERSSLVSRERLGGYIVGLVNNNLPYDERIVKFGNFTEACGEMFADDFLNEGVTAVVCASDLIAIGFVNSMFKRNISVPQQMSITGFDDIALSRYITPAVTTVRQNFSAIGENAFTMLRQLIKGYSPQRMVMNGELVVRDSTAPPSLKNA